MDEIFELTSRHMLVGRLIFIRTQTAFRNIVGFCRGIVNYMSNMFETAQNPSKTFRKLHLEQYARDGTAYPHTKFTFFLNEY